MPKRQPSPIPLGLPLRDDAWIEGPVRMMARKAHCELRMRQHDSLPAPLRDVANGLPRPDFLLPAIDAGCSTFDDAEEWMRLQFGRSFLDV